MTNQSLKNEASVNTKAAICMLTLCINNAQNQLLNLPFILIEHREHNRNNSLI